MQNPFESPRHENTARLEETELIPADRGTRFVAKLIDNVLYFVFLIPLMLGVADESESGNIVFTLVGVVGLLALFAYQTWLITTTGQSLAKKWMKIRIVKTDGAPAGFVHGVFLRSWVMALLNSIPAVGGVIGLVDALMIFGDQSRCLHDRIANTAVIAISYGETA